MEQIRYLAPYFLIITFIFISLLQFPVLCKLIYEYFEKTANRFSTSLHFKKNLNYAKMIQKTNSKKF